MDIKEITAQDFLTFSREQPAYVQVEQKLIELGGGGVKGAEFKKQALRQAGWHYGALVSYGAHVDKAALAFNLIRAVLLEGPNDAESVLAKLDKRTTSTQRPIRK